MRNPTIIPPIAVSKWVSSPIMAISIASSTCQIPRQISTIPTIVPKFFKKYPADRLPGLVPMCIIGLFYHSVHT